MTAPRTVLLAAALLLIPGMGRAQEYSRTSLSFALLNTQPLGELSTGPGYGIAVAGAYALDDRRIFRLRGELRASVYDHENREICLSAATGCRIMLDMTTDYSIVYLGVGPQVAVPVGPLRLAVDGSLGYSAFAATSALSGVDDHDERFAETTNYEDETFAWSAGGEVGVPVGARWAIALGTRYQHNGVVSYLTEGGITDNPDGSLSFDPYRTEANLLAITLGVTFSP